MNHFGARRVERRRASVRRVVGFARVSDVHRLLEGQCRNIDWRIELALFCRSFAGSVPIGAGAAGEGQGREQQNRFELRVHFTTTELIGATPMPAGYAYET